MVRALAPSRVRDGPRPTWGLYSLHRTSDRALTVVSGAPPLRPTRGPSRRQRRDGGGVAMSEDRPLELTETTSSGFVVGTPDESGTSVSISVASRRLGISVSTLRRRLQRGEVPGAHKTGGPDGLEWRVPVAYLPDDSVTPTPAPVVEDRARELELALATERALRQRAEDEVISLRALLSSALDKLPRALPEATSPEPPTRRRFWRRGS